MIWGLKGIFSCGEIIVMMHRVTLGRGWIEGWREQGVARTIPGCMGGQWRSSHSDYRSVIVTTDAGGGRSRCSGGQKLFRFEAAWLEEEKCPDVVETAWKEARKGETWLCMTH
jgi:hypothetical protein